MAFLGSQGKQIGSDQIRLEMGCNGFPWNYKKDNEGVLNWRGSLLVVLDFDYIRGKLNLI